VVQIRADAHTPVKRGAGDMGIGPNPAAKCAGQPLRAAAARADPGQTDFIGVHSHASGMSIAVEMHNLRDRGEI